MKSNVHILPLAALTLLVSVVAAVRETCGATADRPLRLVAADQAGPSLKIISLAENAEPHVVWEWIPQKDPGLTPKMARGFFAIDECKAIDGGRTLLANASGGGVAAVDVATGRAKWCALLPAANAGPHSVALLPDGRVAVAHSTGGDALQIIDVKGHPLEPAKQKVVNALPVAGAHGVVWDERRGSLFVLGYTNLFEVAYRPATMSVEVLKVWNYVKACVDAWGHDLSPDGVGGYYLTNGTAVWHFDPARGSFEKVLGVRNVKSFSRDASRGDLLTVPRQGWWTDRLHVRGTNGTVRTVGPFPGARFYKARWL